MFCDLQCEEDLNAIKTKLPPVEEDSDPKCGGWGFMSVTHKPVPAAPVAGTDGGVTYKGCYNVKENPDIFNKLVANSEWMTNEVWWRLCTLVGLWINSNFRSVYVANDSRTSTSSQMVCVIPCGYYLATLCEFVMKAQTS